MTRQTSKAQFQAIEREIRTNPDMQSYIRQTYSPATVIRQVSDKNWNDDVLSVKQSALMAGCSLKTWYKVIIGL